MVGIFDLYNIPLFLEKIFTNENHSKRVFVSFINFFAMCDGQLVKPFRLKVNQNDDTFDTS